MPGLAGAQAWAAAHRKQLLAGGGAVAVGLGLYSARHRAAGDEDAQAGDGGVPAKGTYGVNQPAETATGGDAYDSTGNDVYNALQPQLEENQSLINRLLETVGNIPKSIPVRATPARKPAKPKSRPKKGGKGSKKKRGGGRPRRRPARGGGGKKKVHHRHPPRAPHKQGGTVVNKAKAAGNVVPVPQSFHRTTHTTATHATKVPIRTVQGRAQ